jgi:hypothetical protein
MIRSCRSRNGSKDAAGSGRTGWTGQRAAGGSSLIATHPDRGCQVGPGYEWDTLRMAFSLTTLRALVSSPGDVMSEDLAVVHKAGLGGLSPLVSMKVSAGPKLSTFGHRLFSTPLAVTSRRTV